MRRFRWLMVLSLALMVGCEKPASAPPPPQSAAPATAPATQSAATKPANTIMTISGTAVVFPPARLRVDRKGSRVTAMLFSVDPKDAINANYDGNSFYLEMDLDADDVDDLSSAMWTFKSTSSERQDSPFGIFLHGHKQQLQPMEARAMFEGGAVPTTVHLHGTFMSYIDDDTAPPDIVRVDAELPVTVTIKKD